MATRNVFAPASPFGRTAYTPTIPIMQNTAPIYEQYLKKLTNTQTPTLEKARGGGGRAFTAPNFMSAQGDLRSRIEGLDRVVANPTTAPGLAEALAALRGNVNAGVSQQQQEIADQVTRRGFGGFQGAGAPDMLGLAQEGNRAFATGQSDLLTRVITEALGNRTGLLGQLAQALAEENSIRQRAAEAAATDTRAGEELDLRAITENNRGALSGFELKQRLMQMEQQAIIDQAMQAEKVRQFNIGEGNAAGLGAAKLGEERYQFDTGLQSALERERLAAQLERERRMEEQRQFDLLYKLKQPSASSGFASAGGDASYGQPYGGGNGFPLRNFMASRPGGGVLAGATGYTYGG
jgi:hypothetical protein